MYIIHKLGFNVDHTRMCSPYFAIDSGQIGGCKCSVLIYSEQYRQVYCPLNIYHVERDLNNVKDYPSSTIKYYDML